MTDFGRLPKLFIVFWLIQVVVVAVLWRVLPSHISSWLLLALVIVNAVLIYCQQFDLPTLTNIALVLALAHLWRGGSASSPLVATLIIFVGVVLSGLIVESAAGPIKKDDLIAWFLIGLFTAEVTTLTEFWPITYIQKSVFCTVIFYFIWQLWRIIDGDKKTIVGHFIFVLLAVMVVITNIIWTTWPGLKTF